MNGVTFVHRLISTHWVFLGRAVSHFVQNICSAFRVVYRGYLVVRDVALRFFRSSFERRASNKMG